MNDEAPASGQMQSAPADPYAAYPDDRAARQSRWPVIFGVLSAVYGLFGMCLQGFGAIGSLFSEQLVSMSGFEMPPMPAAMKWAGFAQASVLFVLGVLLIIGSLMLTQRKALGARLVGAWAVARLVMVVVGLGLGLATLRPNVDYQIESAVLMREQMQARPDIPANAIPPIPDREDAEASAIRMLVVFTLVFSVWPIAMLFVLTRGHVRADVESWKSSAPVA
ncbi:MAG: hypothetical protein GC172_10285 [Phycisphaera sp.]|nr:hypothetical protein [Phycisphaera sp.]